MADLTPEQILEAYTNGFPGVIPNEAYAEEFLSGLENPLFGDAAPALYGSGKGKLSLPFISVLEFDPNAYEEAQKVGDCVSHGTRNAVDVTRAIQIINGNAEGWIVRSATEAIYGCRQHAGDGMSGEQAANYVHKQGGILLRLQYGKYDLSKYTGDRGWGSRGVPEELNEEARKHQVGTLALIQSVEEARDALANGYGLACCSDFGFSSKRDDKGFAKRQGSWSHCEMPGTMISSKRIYPIEKINIGDLVYGHDGKRHRVTNTFERDYKGKTVRFQTRGSFSQVVTAEHPLLVKRPVSNDVVLVPYLYTEPKSGKIKTRKKKDYTKQYETLWIKAEDLQETDCLVVPFLRYDDDNFQPLIWENNRPHCVNIPKNIYEPDDDIAWFFGMYAANGSTDYKGLTQITLDVKKQTAINRAKTAFIKLGMNPIIKDKGTYVRIIAHSVVLSDNMKKMCGGGKQKGDEPKKIPEFMFSGWNTKEIVKGIKDGDGHITKGGKAREQIDNTSLELILQSWHLLIANGDYPNMRKMKDRPNNQTGNIGKTNYGVSWKTNRREHGKYLTSYDENYYVLPIKEISHENYSGKVYNLEVEDANSYIANGRVSHNCMAWEACNDTEGESSFLIVNSWGPNWISGPKAYGQPEGSFWIHEETASQMIRARGTYAFSMINGFPPQALPDYGTGSFF